MGNWSQNTRVRFSLLAAGFWVGCFTSRNLRFLTGKMEITISSKLQFKEFIKFLFVDIYFKSIMSFAMV